MTLRVFLDIVKFLQNEKGARSAMPEGLKNSTNTWRMLMLMGVIVLLGGILFAWSRVLFPVMAAFLIAYATHPLASFFEKRHLPRIFGFLCVLLIFLALLSLVLLVFVPAIVHEFMSFGEKIPHWRELAEKHAGSLLADLEKRYPGAYSLLRERATQWGEENFPAVAQRLINWTMGLLGSILGLAKSFLSWIFILVITAYLTIDFHKFIDSLKRLVPRPELPVIEKIGRDVNQVLKDFFVGQFLVAVALGVIYSVGLLFARTPLALVIGPLAGLLALVPYLGFAFGFGMAMLLTLLEYRSLWQVGGVVLTFGLAQVLEGWFLTPRLLGKRVGLHPVWIMVALLLGGEAFGFPGMVVAVPVAAALRVVLLHAMAAYRESSVYLGNDRSEGKEMSGGKIPKNLS